MLGHMGIRPIISNSTPINNKIRIQNMPNNELQLYRTYDIRNLDTIAPLLYACLATRFYKFCYVGI